MTRAACMYCGTPLSGDHDGWAHAACERVVRADNAASEVDRGEVLMPRFVILTIEGRDGVRGTFAGTCPGGLSKEDAFRWAMPLARREISPFGQDDVAVLFFSAESADGA